MRTKARLKTLFEGREEEEGKEAEEEEIEEEGKDEDDEEDYILDSRPQTPNPCVNMENCGQGKRARMGGTKKRKKKIYI